MPTLVIARKPGLDEARIRELAVAIEQSKALKKRWNPRDGGRRALIATGRRSTVTDLAK